MLYRQACELVQRGDYEKARRIYNRLATTNSRGNTRLRALIHNDLAVLEVIEGRHADARREWAKSLEIDGECLQAALNRDLFEAEMSLASAQGEHGELKLEFVPDPRALRELRGSPDLAESPHRRSPRNRGTHDRRSSTNAGSHAGSPSQRFARSGRFGEPVRVATLSFLFNWPLTGGGNMHTAGLVEFLGALATRCGIISPGFPRGG